LSEIEIKAKLAAECIALRRTHQNAPKNSPEINRFILIAARRYWASNAQLAQAFGVSSVTISLITDLNSTKYYRKIHAEFRELGLNVFEDKYYNRELHNKLKTSMAAAAANARLRAERHSPQLWFKFMGEKFEVYFEDGSWYYATHEDGEERKFPSLPCTTYEEAVKLMRATEDPPIG
jgi:hypothetical protein